jgi:hypothetical protein
VYDHVHTLHSAAQTFPVSDVTDEIAEARIVEPCDPHFVLFELIAAEDDELRRPVVAQQNFYEFAPERASSTSDEYEVRGPIHSGILRFDRCDITPFNRTAIVVPLARWRVLSRVSKDE